MRELPIFVGDAEVLQVVVDGWQADVDAVEYLPVGFGAHHWVARQAGTTRLFVTFDILGRRHTADSLEAAYAGAAALRVDWSSSLPQSPPDPVASPRRWPVTR